MWGSQRRRGKQLELKASLSPRCRPSGGEPGGKGCLATARWTPGGYARSPARHPGGSLTFDFSCPRLGTRPARSREKRQDARSSRAMARGGCVSDWPEALIPGHLPSEVASALSHLSSPRR